MSDRTSANVTSSAATLPGDIVTSLTLEGTLHVWEVANLRKRAANLPVIDVGVDAIPELDDNLWFNRFDLPTCRAVSRHAKRIIDADLAYPILLGPSGDVLDGMHRVAKAAFLGLQTIKAVKLRVMPPPDHVFVNYIDAPLPTAQSIPPDNKQANADADSIRQV